MSAELLKKARSLTVWEQLKKVVKNQNKHVFYRIVDFNQQTEQYTLQCINMSAIFYANIVDIVFDGAILNRLHPIQACYMGIEYGKGLRQNPSGSNSKNYSDSCDTSRFGGGVYEIHYQDRKNNVCFVEIHTGEEFVMDPRDIALSEKVIEKFDASQAFHIGLLAGLKMHDPTRQVIESDLYDRSSHPYLWLVK